MLNSSIIDLTWPLDLDLDFIQAQISLHQLTDPVQTQQIAVEPWSSELLSNEVLDRYDKQYSSP